MQQHRRSLSFLYPHRWFLNGLIVDCTISSIRRKNREELSGLICDFEKFYLIVSFL